MRSWSQPNITLSYALRRMALIYHDFPRQPRPTLASLSRLYWGHICFEGSTAPSAPAHSVQRQDRIPGLFQFRNLGYCFFNSASYTEVFCFFTSRTRVNILSSCRGKALSRPSLTIDLEVKRSPFGAWRFCSPLLAHNGFLLLHSCFAKVCQLLMTDSLLPQIPWYSRLFTYCSRSFCFVFLKEKAARRGREGKNVCMTYWSLLDFFGGGLFLKLFARKMHTSGVFVIAKPTEIVLL